MKRMLVLKYTAWSISVLLAAACSPGRIAPFPQLDQDGDGRISEEEAAGDATLGEMFAQVDRDQDGQLTAGEYLEAATR
jgi:Ca2+-binding EF-hand superfamily protein